MLHSPFYLFFIIVLISPMFFLVLHCYWLLHCWFLSVQERLFTVLVTLKTLNYVSGIDKHITTLDKKIVISLHSEQMFFESVKWARSSRCFYLSVSELRFNLLNSCDKSQLAHLLWDREGNNAPAGTHHTLSPYRHHNPWLRDHPITAISTCVCVWETARDSWSHPSRLLSAITHLARSRSLMKVWMLMLKTDSKEEDTI